MSAQPETVKDIPWETVSLMEGENHFWFYNMPDGCRLTVVDRMTGFSGPYGGCVRDTETGFRDEADLFWLASGMFDIRDFPDLTIQEAIVKVKASCNNVCGR